VKTTILSFILSTLNAQAAVDSSCTGKDILRIERPIFPDQQSSPTFQYAFQVKKGSDPKAPTVIHLPGGPGQRSMGIGPTNLPSRLTEIFTDPRSLGCNGGGKFPIEALNTEYLASDILAIIKTLKLKNYFFHGVSYGTMLATVAAFHAEREGYPPRGIVLEGVLGRALLPGETGQGFIDQWNLLKRRLAPEVQIALRGASPLGHPQKTWGIWIKSMLSFGEIPGYGDVLFNQLSYLKPSADPSLRKKLRHSLNLAGKEEKKSERFLLLNRAISCREITEEQGEIESDVRFEHGEFVKNTPNYCGNLRLDRPFDSARYPLRSPIFYFSGARDPNTPLALAHYHFEHQTKARKYFVLVPGASHNSLSQNLDDCADKVWNAIVSDPSTLSVALSRCALTAKLQ